MSTVDRTIFATVLSFYREKLIDEATKFSMGPVLREPKLFNSGSGSNSISSPILPLWLNAGGRNEGFFIHRGSIQSDFSTVNIYSTENFGSGS